MVKEVIEDLDWWGWRGQRVILKSDGEQSIFALKKAIGEYREGEWIPEENVVG